MTVIRVDLNCEELLRKVDNEQDRVLLKEAVLALDGGALRAAYVMTWIACAESIKRRLRECANWDKEAESILTQIKGLENNQKAIDGKLVDFAKAVGVVDDIESGQLATIYQNRNIYGHPYERTPTRAEVISAIELVCEAVLFKPIRYKHKFIKELQGDLFHTRNFLDDTNGAVDEFVDNFVLKRIDPSVYVILINRCVQQLENIYGDKLNDVYFRRVSRLCQTLIVHGCLFGGWTSDEWHQRLNRFPNAMHGLCSHVEIIKCMDERARNTWLANAIERAEMYPAEFEFLHSVKECALLTNRQIELLHSGIRKCTGYALAQTKIPLNKLFSIIKPKFSAYNYTLVNDAFEFIFGRNFDELSTLTVDDMKCLGASLVMAANRGAYSVQSILRSIEGWERKVPLCVVDGMLNGTFIASDGRICVLRAVYENILKWIETIEPESVRGMLEQVAGRIDAAQGMITSIDVLVELVEKFPNPGNSAPVIEAIKRRLQSQAKG